MKNLSTQEVSLFRNIVRTAPVLMIIFRLDPRPVGQVEVSEILEIDRKTASKYLESLRKIGLITRINYHSGYTLTQGGRQLVLGIGDDRLLPGSPPQLGNSSAVNAVETVEKIPTVEIDPTVENLHPATTAVKDLSLESLTTESTAEAVAPEISAVAETQRYQAVFRALKAAGIGEPKRSELCLDPLLTGDFVEGHTDKAVDDKVGTGMLIHRLEQHDELPAKYGPAPRCESCGRPRNRHKPYCGQSIYDIDRKWDQ